MNTTTTTRTIRSVSHRPGLWLLATVLAIPLVGLSAAPASASHPARGSTPSWRVGIHIHSPVRRPHLSRYRQGYTAGYRAGWDAGYRAGLAGHGYRGVPKVRVPARSCSRFARGYRDGFAKAFHLGYHQGLRARQPSCWFP